MPVITVQFIKDVVANDAQKQEILVKVTDAFLSVVGEVARPYTYCIIQETPQQEWSIGGKAMPDLAFLIGPEYAAMHAKANGIMSAFVEQTKAQKAASGADDGTDALAEKMWQGTKE
jgi:4-oxalocrotonate tautomerase